VPTRRDPKKTEETSSESDIDRIEEEAQKDIEDRDALAKRIKERDKKNTRHIVSKSETRAQNEAAKRLKLAEKEDAEKDMMDQLRHQSRKEYLAKRKEDQKHELQAIVHDDEFVFGNEKYHFFY
jgi:pre-mRNA-splicing factor ATP-dependent RNA helicase DHX16